ncbi:MAG: formimidoylglutamate deiminase [Pseudomonadota bacterium]
MAGSASRFLAPLAWVGGAWASDVLLEAGDDGLWRSVTPNAPAELQRTATRLAGPVIPGLVNAHSHAFQRAIAGLTERRGSTGSDDFWSWRDRMYSAANRITPAQLEAIAAQLYSEMLAGGYTHVCEFHYLHNDVSGQPYADPLEMPLALVRAARRAGIGLTLLPTLYMRAGFGAAGLRQDQRRFASTPEGILRVVEGVNDSGAGGGLVNAGVALHSLRAVDVAALTDMAVLAKEAGLPVHIHIAEQVQEVNDCLAWSGKRPIEWLLEQAAIDARWNLVHATHTTAAELQGVRDAGAAIVICPNTEANLGDGVFDLPGFAQRHGNWSIGSDSHVTRCAMEELRLLEYSQRLSLRRRNVASHADGRADTAGALFDSALAGGEAAASLPVGGIAAGRRADFAVVDAASPALLGIPAASLMDAMVFSAPAARLADVYVAGRRVSALGREPEIAEDFTRAMKALWA